MYIKRLWGPFPCAFVFYFVLAVIFTWPLFPNFSKQVIGPFYGDNLEYVWKLWWVKHALLDLGQSPWFQPDIYYPYGFPLAYGELTPIHTFVGLPLTALFGPLVTYNYFMFVSVVLSGSTTFLLARELTGGMLGGLVAGVIFAVSPYQMARIAGHLPLIDTQWIPLFFLFLDRFIRRQRIWDAVWMALCYVAAALSSWYFALTLAVLAPVYLLARHTGGWKNITVNRWLRGGGVFIGLTMILISPFLKPYLELQKTGVADFPLERAAFWSASLTDYLIPYPRNFLWGNWVQRNLTAFPDGLPYEFIVGWGLVGTILAVYGWRHGQLARRGWGWLLGVSFVLSLGPVFKLFGAVIALPMPGGFVAILNTALDWLGQHSLVKESYTLASGSTLTIPLPALLLRWFLPGLAGVRGWGRFAVFAILGVALLAGEGVEVYLRQRAASGTTKPSAKLHQLGIVGVFVFLVLLELYPGPQQLISPSPRAVDRWLATQPEKRTIIEMPMTVALSGPQMFYSMYHGQRLASGYGTYFPILFEQEYPELAEFPSDEALDLLATWGCDKLGDAGGVDLILVDEGLVASDDPLWERIALQPRLRLYGEVGSVKVYVIE